MKLITFSLWGNDPKYCIGAVKNSALSPHIYPDWKCRFYVGASTNKYYVEELEKNNAEVIRMDEQGDWSGMFWRFVPAFEDNVEVMISRDTDSRLSKRERYAVDEWLESDKGFHIMRDHPYHGTAILGGMWGIKKGTISNFKELFEKRAKQDRYDTDQAFLREDIFPLIEHNSTVHDEFFLPNNPFPQKRRGLEFVGQVFDENDETVAEHIQALYAAIPNTSSLRNKRGMS
jgi:hypothetical protein